MPDGRIDDRIEVDGSPIDKTPAIYFIMNKPRGVMTTASDEKGRETVYDLLEPGLPWVGPVGRLDKASEGLLLLTNDSEWAARITEPASHLDKKYHVQVDCVADADLLARIMLGHAVDGEQLCAKGAKLLRHGDKNSWLEITLDEGKNRQIRRLLEALGVRVLATGSRFGRAARFGRSEEGRGAAVDRGGKEGNRSRAARGDVGTAEGGCPYVSFSR